MNAWLLIILLILVGSYLLELVARLLNVKYLSPHLPEEFATTFDQDQYRRSQAYLKATTTFSLTEDSCLLVLQLIFLLGGGFNYLDIWVRRLNLDTITTGILYVGALALLSSLVHLPFRAYGTFILEERFGMNRTSIRTFILDLAKGAFVAAVLGIPMLGTVLWLLPAAGGLGWVYCWIAVVLFSLLLQFLAPVLILPLFNKFSPLEDEPLREKILAYARRQQFSLTGIFTMDGSKRSTKANAFFTGFGRFKKIVFFDTLLDKLDDGEILVVLAHEMGHFKLRHILKMAVGSVLQTGLMFYLLSLFLGNTEISAAFALEQTSTYTSLVCFGFVYAPLSLLLSIFFNHVSRKHELAADNFAARTTDSAVLLISALKKLCRSNLSNLTPHPLMVFLHYSHPPVLQRIDNLRKIKPMAGDNHL